MEQSSSSAVGKLRTPPEQAHRLLFRIRVTGSQPTAYHHARMCRLYRLIIGTTLAALTCSAAGLTVTNPFGDIRIVSTASTQLAARGVTPDGPASATDLAVTQSGEDVHIEVLPRDTTLDLTITLPLGYGVEATTADGDVSVEGMLHLAHLETKTGAIRIQAPLRGIRVTLDAVVPPPDFVNLDRQLFRTSDLPLAAGRPWRLRDRLAEDAVSYGDYSIAAEAPRSVEFSEFTPPAGWPLRFHWEAARALQDTLEPSQASGAVESAAEPQPQQDEGEALFSSNVRMVNLTASVSDSRRRPVPGLTADNFRIAEDGVDQRLALLQDGDAAFNLALVLDMSGSSERHRGPIQDAAREFVEMVRPGDRVAIYALTYGMFQVVSPLTADHDALIAAVANLPGISGATPLYDMIALAYAQELRQLPGERNAMIVLSDGLDNRLTDGSAPSAVKFGDLERMAQEMDAIVYPVYLETGARRGGFQRSRIKATDLKMSERRMRLLAHATGGEIFPADSVEDLDPVFPLIEAELRSVYNLGYYPKNEELDGSWRTVEVSVDKPNLTVRTRPGYYAK